MTIWRARAPYEKNAIFSAWVMRRIGAMGSLAAARGFCRMPLARMVAPSEGSGRDADKGEGIGSVAVGAAPNVAAAAKDPTEQIRRMTQAEKLADWA